MRWVKKVRKSALRDRFYDNPEHKTDNLTLEKGAGTKTRTLEYVNASESDSRKGYLKAFEEAVEYITGHSDVWVATGREIAQHFIDNHYDSTLDDIAAKNAAAASVAEGSA